MNPDGWIEVQKKVFRGWMNQFLKMRSYVVHDLIRDVGDGLAVINLLEILTGESVGKYNRVPRHRAQKLENCGLGVKFVGDRVKLVGIGGEDLVDGKEKLILGFIWTIILRLHIQVVGLVGEEAHHDELLRWVQTQLPSMNIKNLDKDFKDGKAILALLESVRPGTVNLPQDYKSAADNCALAFSRAEETCDIAPLLEPTDMTMVADDLSNRCYISQYRDYYLARDAEHMHEMKPAIVTVLQAKRERDAPDNAYCSIYNKDGSYRASILEDGTVVNCFGVTLGYISLEDGQVADPDQYFLGYISADQVYDDKDAEVGDVDRGTGAIKTEQGSTIFAIDGTGRATGQTEVYLGEFRGVDYHALNTVALYGIFLDPTFTKEDEDK